jgi:hypothetical protein
MALAQHCISGSESLWVDKDEAKAGVCFGKDCTTIDEQQAQAMTVVLFQAGVKSVKSTPRCSGTGPLDSLAP